MSNSNVIIKEMSTVNKTIIDAMIDSKEAGQTTWSLGDRVMIRSSGRIYVFCKDANVSSKASKGYTLEVPFNGTSVAIAIYLWEGISAEKEIQNAKDYLRTQCWESLKDEKEMEFVQTIPLSKFSHWVNPEGPLTVEKDQEGFPYTIHKGWLTGYDQDSTSESDEVYEIIVDDQLVRAWTKDSLKYGYVVISRRIDEVWSHIPEMKMSVSTTVRKDHEDVSLMLARALANIDTI